MTNAEKLKWLGQYRLALRKERMLMDEMVWLRSDAERVSAALGGTPGGGPNLERLPKAVERLDEARRELDEQMAECMAVRMKTVRAIDQLEDAGQREVLRRRFILCQSPEEAANAMQFVVRRVQQLQTAAVRALEVPEEDLHGAPGVEKG